MKSIYQMSFVLFLMLLVSCQEESVVSSEYSTELHKIEAAIAKISTIGVEKESIITSSISLNSAKSYELANIEVQGEHFIPFLYDGDFPIGENTYLIDCDGKETSCESIKCAAKAVKRCLDGGGCATICEAQIMVIPHNLKY